jgi:hypothetical protein
MTTASLMEIVAAIDRSGSMGAVRHDGEGGFNAFLREQREEPGEALLTLVRFDSEDELESDGVDAWTALEHRPEPRGCAALLDAPGRAGDGRCQWSHRRALQGGTGDDRQR